MERKKIQPYIGDTTNFYSDLIRRGLFTYEEISHAVINSCNPPKIHCEQGECLIDSLFESEPLTDNSWTPSDDLRLVVTLFTPHTIRYLSIVFKCSYSVIENRLQYIFNTKNWDEIQSMSPSRKNSFLRYVSFNYERHYHQNLNDIASDGRLV